ncbi:ABC transporter ATP-binding protein [Mesoaciditoga lauensis]|uniref:ABC transporter ATP-binding protein n=1 Tax=Mesoaciditoga lauensis TaxID=1495039 RepID=UPI00056140C8|nr:ABC transporter ATP-binding protein [Mesoaciditoga lauensis]
MAVIDVRNVRKSYGKKKKKTEVLHSIDVKVEKGEIFGLLGKNGAGKTTLIKVMAGLLVPDNAEGRVLGYDVLKEADRIRANVSLVAPTADIGVDPVLTVRQNLLFWATVYGIPSKKMQNAVDEVMEALDLMRYKDAWAMEISAGTRQRLAIARALLVKHELVFLDEPTVKLDMEAAKMIRNFIVDLRNRYNITFFMTTHLIEEAEEICDRVMIIDKGEVKALGSVEDLRRKYSREEEIIVKGNFDERVRNLKKFWNVEIHEIYEEEFGNIQQDTELRFKVENVDSEISKIIEAVKEHGEITDVLTKRLTLNDIFEKVIS